MNMNDKPVVAFLIPFASRCTKSDWDVACSHLRQTLKSVQTQATRITVLSSPDMKRPISMFVLIHDFISYRSIILPPARLDYPVSLKFNRLSKIAAAWAYAKATCTPKYVMKLDADDFISSKLVDWLENAGGEAGYLIKQVGFGVRVRVTLSSALRI